MGFWIIQVVQFLYTTLLMLASMFWRQRHNVRVYEILVRLKLNNSDKDCGCSTLMCMWQQTHDTLHDLTFNYKL